MKIKGLTKANIAKLGIELAPQYDFTDDGNRFRGFIYKDMPLTQCRADGDCYLSIRIDYLENDFTFDEWKEAGGLALEDKFNGVTEFDIEDLISTLEAVIKLREDLNAQCTAPSERDWERWEERVHTEVTEIYSLLDKVKKELPWWEMRSSKLNCIIEYMKTIEARIKWTTVEHIKELNICQQRKEIHKLNTNKTLLGLDWYIERLKEEISI